MERNLMDKPVYLIGDPLHSYIEKGQSTFYLYSAIVPKGSLYYSNSREIVSNQLIIKRKCV